MCSDRMCGPRTLAQPLSPSGLRDRSAEAHLGPRSAESASSETRGDLRKAWRGLCAAIPRAWLVETPVDTLQAVVELAERDGVIGEGLLLLPVGRRRGDSRPILGRDNERLDCALTALGQRLEVGGESEAIEALPASPRRDTAFHASRLSYG